MVADSPPDFRLRLRRDSNAVIAWFRDMWLLGIILLWLIFARDLPSVDQLRDYEPPLPTMVRDAEGKPVHTYARERRVQLEYSEYPQLLVRAYLAAEDRTFFSHGGIDYPGIVSAILTNLTNDGRPIGASTITQQVAKNLLLTREVSYTRKIREAILATRIEAALSKEQILELYLNEIPLGRRSFGVQAAARAYFDKDVDQLALHEMAFLAILPKAPETYGRARHADKAVARRNFVLSEMLRNGWITAAQRDAARAMPLGLTNSGNTAIAQVGGYYMEEVRRQLISEFGETADAGPHSVYAGGLWVRTAYDGKMQAAAASALRRGLIRYDAGKGWSGPIATIEADDQWASRLASSFIGLDYDGWRVAAVISKSGGEAQIGFSDGSTGRLPAGAASLGYRLFGDAPRRPDRGEGQRQRRLRAAQHSRSVGRLHRRKPAFGTHLCDAGRVRCPPVVVQPRNPGRTPAGIDDQALRLCDRARQWHDPRDADRRRSVLRLSGRQPRQQMLPQFRRRRRRGRTYDALGPRTIAQPDDSEGGEPGRHGADRRHHPHDGHRRT